jgi:hypothetical protein
MQSPLWQKIYREAVRTEHPDPAKVADSCIRARIRSLALKESRHKTLVLDKLPEKKKTTGVQKKSNKKHFVGLL